MKLWLKEQYLKFLKNYTIINLSKNLFDHTNFNIFQFLIFLTVMAFFSTVILFNKINHFNIISLLMFSFLILMDILFFVATLIFINIINKSYKIVKKESQNAINIIEKEFIELEKEKIMKEQKWLNNQLNNDSKIKSKNVKKI
jgi:hypothetical protein